MNAGRDDFTGARLGRYRVLRLIGRGGMGAVYDGLQEDLGRRVAIKVLHPHLSVDREVVERFRREAQATAALAHPNIVQVTDCQWEPGGPLYLVMELLSGMSLGMLLTTQGRLPSKRVAFIAAQLLDALAAAHRAGIVHRDIKPDNVFLTSMAQVHDIVKVLDFGVAKLVGAGPDAALTTTGVAIGTPYYMAPEQARGLPVDARTDLYAVGVCMYHALSGRLPFAAPSFNALMFAIAEQSAPPLASVAPDADPGIVAIVERAMQKDPARRFASAAEMASALAPWAAPTTTVAAATPAFGVTDPTAPTVAAPTPIQMSASPHTARSSGSATWVVVGCVALIFLVIGVAVANILLTRRIEHAKPTAVPDAAPSASAAVATASAPSPSAIAITDASVEAGKIVRDAGKFTIADAAPMADAEPPAPPEPPRPTGGRQIHPTFFQTNNCCEIPTLRAAIAAHSGAYTACVNGGSPPTDKFPMYDLRVAPTGAVTAVITLGAMKPGDGPFHACMQAALRTVSIGPVLPKCDGSSVRVGFNAE